MLIWAKRGGCSTQQLVPELPFGREVSCGASWPVCLQGEVHCANRHCAPHSPLALPARELCIWQRGSVKRCKAPSGPGTDCDEADTLRLCFVSSMLLCCALPSVVQAPEPEFRLPDRMEDGGHRPYCFIGGAPHVLQGEHELHACPPSAPVVCPRHFLDTCRAGLGTWPGAAERPFVVADGAGWRICSFASRRSTPRAPATCLRRSR